MHACWHPAPTAPRNVTLQEISSTHAVIRWTEPEFPNGVVQRYTLSLTNADDGTERNITANQLSINVTGLVPFTQYWIVVFAETVAVGDGSSNFSIQTLQDSKQKLNIRLVILSAILLCKCSRIPLWEDNFICPWKKGSFIVLSWSGCAWRKWRYPL